MGRLCHGNIPQPDTEAMLHLRAIAANHHTNNIVTDTDHSTAKGSIFQAPGHRSSFTNTAANCRSLPKGRMA